MTSRLIEHEVLVRPGRTPLLLSSFQKRLWDAVGAHSFLGVSAPTSAGKSFVLVNRAIDVLEAGRDVVYVVPTLSLIQQVTADFRKAALLHKSLRLEVMQTVTSAPTDDESAAVYVLTQERALTALAQPHPFRQLELVVFDEIQNIERVANEDSERSQTLFDVVRRFRDEHSPRRIVLCGPRVRNMAQLSKSLLGPDAKALSDELPPVVNITYSLTRQKGTMFLRQHAAFSPMVSQVELELFPPGHRLAGQRYQQPVIDALGHVVERLRGSGVLVFSPTSRQAGSTARQLAAGRAKSNNPLAIELAEYLRDSVHPDYPLAECVESELAYHHGKVPQHARVCIERAFAQRVLDTVMCTTTLMQGVNLPAKTLIARNPDLFVKRSPGATRLTSYEFANLRGRAGRLMRDFVGRTLVLDEASFVDSSIELGEAPERDVASGYAERFSEHREAIVKVLREGSVVSDQDAGGDLITRVRHAVLKDSATAPALLARAGVALPHAVLALVAQQLKELTVPAAICALLPYWDPFAIDLIYLKHLEKGFPRLPRIATAAGFVDNVSSALQVLKQTVPYYYTKYVGDPSDREVVGILLAAQGWATQKPLSQILSRPTDKGHIEGTEIDRRTNVITQRVCFDLPKLLRPLVLIQDETNPLLGFVELGAYLPGTRRMIELGIPRETACRLTEAGVQDDVRGSTLVNEIGRAIEARNYWEREQVFAVLPQLRSDVSSASPGE